MVIRLSKCSVGEEETGAVARVIQAGYLGMGSEVMEFEQELKEYFGGDREVVCVVNGTAALHLSVSCLDIGPGDEVLVPTITYVACFQAIAACGARPVACDVQEEDVFLDLVDAERRLTSRTRAVMPVHYASSARNVDEVYAFARANGLRVIEDAAHSFGCQRRSRKVGSEGDIVCFSFDGIKNITCGEGGALVTSDVALAQRFRDARLLGVEKDTEHRYAGERSWKYDVCFPGFRYHMSNLMAAIGREQLKKLPRFSERRSALAKRYRDGLDSVSGVALLDLDWDGLVPHIFVVKVRPGTRDGLVDKLKAAAIETGFHYQPNHQLSLFSSGITLPVAERLAGQLVTLPLHPDLATGEQDHVIASIKEYYAHAV